MGTRFRLVGLILSVVLVAVAAECASAPPEQPKKGSEASPAAQAPKPVATAALATPKTAAPRSGGTLKIGVLLDAISLDPHRASSPSTRMIYGNIHDTLTVLDFDAKLGPGLAERWEAVAPTRWRFYLRKGVKFHSGEPFNAAAVKAHFDRVLDPKRPGAALGTLKGVKTVEMVDDYTVEFITGQPTGALPMVLSAPQTSITNAAQAKKLGADYGTRPSGTGPFKFEEWKKGASITLVRNPDYWGGAPYLDKVEFRIIPEDSTRTLAYDNGEIDILYSPPGHMLAKLKADKNTTISQAVSFRTLFAGLNRKAPGLEDVRVRQALSHAIDRKAIADFVLEGIGIPAVGFISPTVAGFAPVGLYLFDPAKAKALLAEAGWKSGAGGMLEKGGAPFKIALWTTPEDPKNAEIAQTIQAELKKLGIDVSVQMWDLAAFQEKLKDMAHGIYIYGSTAATGDIDHQLGLNFLSATIPWSNRNHTGMSNPKLDSLAAEGKATTDPAKRTQVYTQVLQILKDEVPWIPIYHTLELAATKSYVKNFKVHPAIKLDVAKVWLDK